MCLSFTRGNHPGLVLAVSRFGILEVMQIKKGKKERNTASSQVPNRSMFEVDSQISGGYRSAP